MYNAVWSTTAGPQTEHIFYNKVPILNTAWEVVWWCGSTTTTSRLCQISNRIHITVISCQKGFSSRQPEQSSVSLPLDAHLAETRVTFLLLSSFGNNQLTTYTENVDPSFVWDTEKLYIFPQMPTWRAGSHACLPVSWVATSTPKALSLSLVRYSVIWANCKKIKWHYTAITSVKAS